MLLVLVLVLGGLILWVVPAESGSLWLSWNPNAEPDLAGYKVYYGTSSRRYGPPTDVGLVTHYELTDLEEKITYYVTVTAYDTARNESGFSQEASGVPSGRNIFYVPYVTAEEPWWTSLSLFNAGSAEAEVVAVAYDGEGNELGRGSSIVLKPNGRWTGRVQALFSAPLTGLVASLHLELLTGSLQRDVFLGTQDGRQLGSFPLQEAGHSRLAFPLPSPDRPTGMVLILKNLEEGSNALALRLLERDGREMSETTVLLSPLGSAVGPLEDFFGEMLSPEAASLLVMGERPFVALGLVGDPSQGELTVVEGFPLP